MEKAERRAGSLRLPHTLPVCCISALHVAIRHVCIYNTGAYLDPMYTCAHIHTHTIHAHIYAYMCVHTHTLLNTTYSVNIMLFVWTCSGLTTLTLFIIMSLPIFSCLTAVARIFKCSGDAAFLTFVLDSTIHSSCLTNIQQAETQMFVRLLHMGPSVLPSLCLKDLKDCPANGCCPKDLYCE